MNLIAKTKRARAPRGKLQAKANPEAARLWHTRDIEPPLCEPFGMACLLVTDPDEAAHRVYAMQVFELVAYLPVRHRMVLALRYVSDMTRQEIADCLGVSRQRVGQIENDALRSLRIAIVKKFGVAA